MIPRSLQPAPSAKRERSKLDRAIIASVVAMAAMNLLVFANQLHTSPLLLALVGHATGTDLA